MGMFKINVRVSNSKNPQQCPVIFVPEGSLFLLEATALKNFGLEVDPTKNS